MKNFLIAITTSIFIVSSVNLSWAEEPQQKEIGEVALKQHPKGIVTLKRRHEQKNTNLSASLKSWLENMRKRVRSSNTQHNQVVAVASVRGSQNVEPERLYWKGKENKSEEYAKEISQFDQALELALKGDDSAAIAQLEVFLKTFPDSPLTGNAKATLAMLSEVK